MKKQTKKKNELVIGNNTFITCIASTVMGGFLSRNLWIAIASGTIGFFLGLIIDAYQVKE